MEVGPTAHYIMGGVQVDTDTTESSIQGLLAAGEVAAGLHGANRLGGNSLSDLLVFGKRAGEHAVRYCLSYHSERTEESSEAYLRPHGLDPSASSQDDNNNIPQADIETAIQDALAPFEPKEYQENPYHLQQELKELMDYRCGIIRNENELTVGLEKLEQLKARAQNVYVENKDRTLNTAWHAALDLKSLLTVSEMMLRSARMRRESRGAHTRDDYPNEDPEWGKKNIVLKKENGEMTITHAPLPVMPEKLKELTKL